MTINSWSLEKGYDHYPTDFYLEKSNLNENNIDVYVDENDSVQKDDCIQNTGGMKRPFQPIGITDTSLISCIFEDLKNLILFNSDIPGILLFSQVNHYWAKYIDENKILWIAVGNKINKLFKEKVECVNYLHDLKALHLTLQELPTVVTEVDDLLANLTMGNIEKLQNYIVAHNLILFSLCFIEIGINNRLDQSLSDKFFELETLAKTHCSSVEEVIHLSLKIRDCMKANIIPLSSIKKIALCYLTELPQEISQLPNLKNFEMYETEISILPKEIWNLTKLKNLALKSKKLNSLSNEIGLLKNLEKLKLSNGLSELPQSFINLSNLKFLTLGENKFKSFPKDLFKMTNLTYLDMNRNHLEEIPDEIGKLTNLIELSLMNNNINVFQRSLIQLTNLVRLNLSYNKLRVLPDEIGQMCSLKSFYLGHNFISQLPDPFSKLTNLSLLTIEKNNLITFSNNLMLLQTGVNLQGNPLVYLPPRKVWKKSNVINQDIEKLKDLLDRSDKEYEAQLDDFEDKFSDLTTTILKRELLNLMEEMSDYEEPSNSSGSVEEIDSDEVNDSDEGF